VRNLAFETLQFRNGRQHVGNSKQILEHLVRFSSVYAPLRTIARIVIFLY